MNAGQSPANGTPVAEFEITSAFATALLADQHPDLARLPLRLVGEGWDNVLFRLGDWLAVRLPRRAAAANLICHEQTWLPRLAAQLSLPVPAPCRIGTSALGYPWRWSVVPWLPGQSADENQPVASQATKLGTFLRSLHVPAPADAPVNPLRGVPLRQRAAGVQERMQRLSARTNLITPQIRQVWEAGLTATVDVSSTWLHGDLHPRNVLVEDGIISGIIDWGDITSGDCATDLASIWMLFAEAQARHDALAAYGELSEATLQRAKAWAVLFGVMFVDTGLVDNPRNATIGERILKRIGQATGCP
jgi:aminoglycoside phosphotransferase (APT) family kinase protein